MTELCGWDNRYLSLVGGKVQIFEDDSRSSPAQAKYLVNGSTAVTWHGTPGRYLFSLTPQGADKTLFLEAADGRARQNWLSTLHENGAKIVQPPRKRHLLSGSHENKGWLNLVELNPATGEGPSELMQLIRFVETSELTEQMLLNQPQREQELSSLRKALAQAKRSEASARNTVESNAAQLLELEKTKGKLEGLLSSESNSVAGDIALLEVWMPHHD